MCEPGYYNDIEGARTPTACRKCSAGKYCPGYMSEKEAGLCAAGYYCSGGAKYAKNHDTVEQGGNPTGGRCPAGSYCPEGSKRPIQCGTGKYCHRQGLAQESGNCAPGYYCKEGSTAPTPDGSEPDKGEPCPLGMYCQEGKEAVECPVGSYMPYRGASSLIQCIPCDPGKYCHQSGAFQITGNCIQGYFCSGGASSSTPLGGICPKGHMCEEGSEVPKPCPITHYQRYEGQSKCEPCQAGYFCNQTIQLPCPPGFYCQALNNKLPCPPGTYLSTTGNKAASDCKSCEPGYACLGFATTDSYQVQCQEGYYCQGGATTDMPTTPQEGGGVCQQGQYCPKGSYAPTSCDVGKYCPTKGLGSPAGKCQPGYYCNGGSKTSVPRGPGGNICPVGRYCPAGSSSPMNCPDSSNQFINYEGAGDLVNCEPCPAGLTCHDGQLTSVPCPEGYFCDHDGSKTPCEPGYRCPQGSRDQVACAPGTYQTRSQSNQCLICLAGKYCEGLATVIPTPCPDGYWCPEGTVAGHTNSCPIGYRGRGEGLSSQERACRPCDPGKYCDKPGLSLALLPSCLAGYFCTKGAKVPTPRHDDDCLFEGDCGPCPPGHYCEQSSTNGVHCPAGTYMPYPGARSAQDCIPVPPGKFSTKTGLEQLPTKTSDSFGDCQAGYICTGGSYSPAPTSFSIGYQCDAGYYCVAGATIQRKCPVGMYQDETGASSCKDCPKGKYCLTQGVSSPKSCEPGYYCPEGSQIPTPCPRGTYSPNSGNISEDDCRPCPLGTYCETTGLASADSRCDPGYICVQGATSATPYAQDYSDTNQVNGFCPKGYYCNKGARLPEQCISSKYNPSLGQAECFDCPPGYYCSGVAIHTLDQTYECQAGYVCRGGAFLPTPQDIRTGYLCPKEHYCEQGSGEELNCPDGEYQEFAGQSMCHKCPRGFTCQVSVVRDCVARKFCPEGSSYGKLCENGRENELDVNTRLTSNQECAFCPQTKFCMGGVVIGDCHAGYYCQFGAPHPTSDQDNASPCPSNNYCHAGEDNPNVCPNQKYTSGEGMIQESDCVDCPNGYYCVSGSSNICPKGAYCPNGVSAPAYCPTTTYNDKEGMYSPAHCLPCPAGYFCKQDGVGDLDQQDDTGQYKFRCKPGHYCVQRAAFEIPCPAAKYRPPLPLGTSYESCIDCPSGYYCPQGTGDPIPCKSNQYCERSSKPLPCPAGKQCLIQKSPGRFPEQEMIVRPCPVGYFCPMGYSGKQPCLPSNYCGEEGLFYEHICKVDTDTGSCKPCEPGYYSSGVLSCKPCEPGYVCLGGTNTRYPENIPDESGYPCPPGYFCLQGSSKESPCPIGTYNPAFKGKNLQSCLTCRDNSFNDKEGRASCRSCGPEAHPNSPHSSCTCHGAFKAFQSQISTCKCIPGYIQERGSSHCTPKQLPYHCILDHLGNCATSCQCESGVRTSQGICACYFNQPNECGPECQKDFLKVKVSSNNEITMEDPAVTQHTVTIPLLTLQNTYGEVLCQIECPLISVVMGEGALTSYEPSAEFVSIFQSYFTQYQSVVRKLSGFAIAFSSPVLCIVPGTIVAFDTSRGSYPVYVKDSRLNTDLYFDYSYFTILASRMSRASASIKTFFFTFSRESSVYVFQDSHYPNQKYIIAVRQDCPVAYLSELSEASLDALGITSQQRQLHTPYWPIGLVIVILVLVIVVVSGVLAHCQHLTDYSWSTEDGGLQHTKESSDLRLLAVERAMQEMITQLQEAKKKRAPEDWLKANLDKMENFEKEAQTVVERVGLREPQDALLSSSVTTEEENSGSYSQPVEVKLEDFDTTCSIIGSEIAEYGGEEEREEPQWEIKKKLAQKHQGFLESQWVRRLIERRKADFDSEVRKYEFSKGDETSLTQEFEVRIVQLQRWLREEEEKLMNHLLRELEKRRKNSKREEYKLNDVLARERALKGRHTREREALEKALVDKENEIEEGYKEELQKQRRKELRECNSLLKRFKDEWHWKLKKAKDQADIRELEEKHAKEYKELVEEMTRRQKSPEELQNQAQERIEQLRYRWEDLMREHIRRQEKELMEEVIEEKIRLQAECGLYKEEELVQEGEKEKKLEEELQREVALEQLRNEQITQMNLVEIEFRNKMEQLEIDGERGKLALPSQEELERIRQYYGAAKEGAQNQEELENIRAEQQREQDQVMEKLEKERALQKRMNGRQQLVLKYEKELKMLAVERSHDKDVREFEKSHRERADIEWEERTLRYIDLRVRSSDKSFEELPLQADALLSSFNFEQLKKLLNREYLEAAGELTDRLYHELVMKLHELKYTRDLFAQQFGELEQATKDAIVFSSKTEELEESEKAELANIQAKYKLKQMDQEGKLRLDLAQKFSMERAHQKETQLRQKEEIIERLIELYSGNNLSLQDFLRGIKQRLMVNEAEDLRSYLNYLVLERKWAIVEIQKALYFDSQADLNRFEAAYQEQARIEETRQKLEDARDRRKLMKDQRIKFQERVRRLEAVGLPGLTQFVIETEDNLRRRDNILKAQREKQFQNVQEKVKLRKMKQQRLKTLEYKPERIMFSSSSFQQGQKVGLRKAEINYKVKLKEWAQQCRESPPRLRPQESGEFESMTGFSGVDDTRRLGSSLVSQRSERRDEQLLNEKVERLEELAARILQKDK